MGLHLTIMEKVKKTTFMNVYAGRSAREIVFSDIKFFLVKIRFRSQRDHALPASFNTSQSKLTHFSVDESQLWCKYGQQNHEIFLMSVEVLCWADAVLSEIAVIMELNT